MRRFLFLCIATACSTDTFSADDAGGGDAASVDAPNCATGFCAASKATTCNDFDEGSYPNKWTTDTNLIQLGTSNTQATSCPSSLAITVPSMTAAGLTALPHAWAAAALGPVSDVTVVLDALLPTFVAPDSGFVDGFAFLALRGTADLTWTVRLERSGDTAWFLRIHQGASTSPSATIQPDILTGAWNHMTLTVHFAADTTGSASLTYQTTSGTATAELTGKATLPPTGDTPAAVFAVGAYPLSQISQTYTLFYDSVLINAN